MKHAFALSVAVGVLAISAVTAAAYFGAVGSGTIGGVQAGTQSSTVSFAAGASTYSGPSTTNLVPGGTVTTVLTITCTAAPPCTISNVVLQSWAADGAHATAGCTSALMPGSFTVTSNSATFPLTIAALNGTATDNIAIMWNNLPSINQSACAGGSFTFQIAAA